MKVRPFLPAPFSGGRQAMQRAVNSPYTGALPVPRAILYLGFSVTVARLALTQQAEGRHLQPQPFSFRSVVTVASAALTREVLGQHQGPEPFWCASIYSDASDS